MIVRSAVSWRYECDGDRPDGEPCTEQVIVPPGELPPGEWDLIPESAGSANVGEVVHCPRCSADLDL